MKKKLLKILVFWRRLRYGSACRQHSSHDYITQANELLLRANPSAAWQSRANWLIDLAEWLGKVTPIEDLSEFNRIRTVRIQYLLDWLDQHLDVQARVSAVVRNTLQESFSAELFGTTGIPSKHGFLSEISERILKKLLLRSHHSFDLSSLFTAMFPSEKDALWLQSLNHALLMRVWNLCANEETIQHFAHQIDESLTYLMATILALGISPEFRHRMGPDVSLNDTSFMQLRRALEAFLANLANEFRDTSSDIELQSLRRAIAACQAQLDKIYAHLNQHGVSVDMVYNIDKIRAQLQRMNRLVDLLALRSGQEAAQVQLLLSDLITVYHQRSSIRGLLKRNFSLLARKMVERNADHGEHYIAHNAQQYRAMLSSACRGGIIMAATTLCKLLIHGAGFARFFEGLFASINYSVSFLFITAIGGSVATKQPAVTAPTLAAKMESLDTTDGLRSLVLEIRHLLRSQAAAVFGNLMAVVPVMLVISLAIFFYSDGHLMSQDKARAQLQSLSLFGPTPLFAALTGVLLWISSLAAGFADNWFALHRIKDVIANQRRLIYILGKKRADRFSAWLEHNISGIVANISIGFLLGMTPILAEFFGLPLDVRHVTLSIGVLTAAVTSLGWTTFTSLSFWLALTGTISVGVINVCIAFFCALTLAMRAREIPMKIRFMVLRAVWRKFTESPLRFLLPENNKNILIDKKNTKKDNQNISIENNS